MEHSKKCLARAIICAVENARDNESYDVHALLASNFADDAVYYLDSRLADCVCDAEKLYATQGGGIAIWNGWDYVWKEIPDSFPEFRVGDLIPIEWDIIPIV